MGNTTNLGFVLFLWFIYTLASVYFLVLVSPYFWINYSPAITIVGIILSVPGLYNAIKCYFTGEFTDLI